ncbi:MAG: TonB family protein [Steroidobacteraceae bacterium]
MANIHPLFKESNAGDTDSQNKESRAGKQPSVLALTNNENLLEITRRSAPAGSQVIDTHSLDAMMTRCRSVHPGVLLLDATCCPDISGTVIQLLQDLPDLVVVVAGRSEDSAMLMKLTAAGHIYRFLLTPLAHNQTKLTLEAAMTQHHELAAANQRRERNADEGGARKSYLPAYIGLGAALIVVVGGVFYGLSRMGAEQNVVATGTQNDGAAAKELTLADAALAAGKLLEPPGESALDLYRSALAIEPKNARAQAGIDAVAGKLLEKAEAALSAEQLEAAVTALEQARDVAPGNSRLKFLDGQLARSRELLKLTQAQDLGKKVRTLLATAQEQMDDGKLVSPAGNNARDSILEARKVDPTDPSIAQMQRNLSNRLIENARRAAEQNQMDQAQALLATARQMGSAGADLSAVERSLTEARNKSTSAATEAQLAAAQKAAAAAQAERDAALAAAAAAQQKAAEATAAAQPAATAPAATSANTATAAAPLKRIKIVQPVYPQAAKNRGVSGWVEVGFTVNATGNVQDVRVLNSEPKDVFDWAAVQAVEQWRFEPPMRDGKAIAQTTKVKLSFASPK